MLWRLGHPWKKRDHPTPLKAPGPKCGVSLWTIQVGVGNKPVACKRKNFNSLGTITDISAHLFLTFRVRSAYIRAIAIYLKFYAKCRRSSLSFAYNRRSHIRHAPTGVCGMCGSFPTCNGARADTSGRLDTGLFTIPGKRLRCVTAKQLS